MQDMCIIVNISFTKLNLTFVKREISLPINLRIILFVTRDGPSSSYSMVSLGWLGKYASIHIKISHFNPICYCAFVLMTLYL